MNGLLQLIMIGDKLYNVALQLFFFFLWGGGGGGRWWWGGKGGLRSVISGKQGKKVKNEGHRGTKAVFGNRDN